MMQSYCDGEVIGLFLRLSPLSARLSGHSNFALRGATKAPMGDRQRPTGRGRALIVWA